MINNSPPGKSVEMKRLLKRRLLTEDWIFWRCSVGVLQLPTRGGLCVGEGRLQQLELAPRELELWFALSLI